MQPAHTRKQRGRKKVNWALISVLVLLIAWAGWHTALKIRKGGGCCGEHAAKEKRTLVADRNKSHYPYLATLRIDGMTCENCARRTENALNAMEGVWAHVSIEKHSANVLCKMEPDETKIREAVRQAGYIVSAYAVTRT